MGKNVKKVISLVLVFAMILTGMTFTGFDAKAADAANDTSATAEYEIYPTPRSVVYQDSSFTLADKTNVVYDSTIDEATQKRLNEVLAIQNITGTVTGAVASNGMNVLVGTKGSDGAVEKWFNDHVTYADDLFDKRDAYVLAIQDNVIAVLGKDTDAAFYGLSSLKMIFNQVTEKAVRKLQIEDYASGQYRGFIEGYYGIPWSVEDRISLMKFGGDFKMNMYIYDRRTSHTTIHSGVSSIRQTDWKRSDRWCRQDRIPSAVLHGQFIRLCTVLSQPPLMMQT